MKHGDIVKRGMDIVGGAVGTALAAVPMAAVAAGVYLSMGRPVFYVQPRQGKDGQYFNMIKFRSMTNEADTDGNLLPDAQRVTRFGRFIRRTSLDELPQFVNVLKGDMSLVGPRPAYFVVPEEYSERFAVRPGLTGLPSDASRIRRSRAGLSSPRGEARTARIFTRTLGSRLVYMACFLEILMVTGAGPNRRGGE